jgi:hypothetical protein
MSTMTRLRSGVLALFRRRRTEEDLDEERRTFFAEAVDARIAAGLTADAARRRVPLAALRFE